MSFGGKKERKKFSFAWHYHSGCGHPWTDLTEHMEHQLEKGKALPNDTILLGICITNKNFILIVKLWVDSQLQKRIYPKMSCGKFN